MIDQCVICGHTEDLQQYPFYDRDMGKNPQSLMCTDRKACLSRVYDKLLPPYREGRVIELLEDFRDSCKDYDVYKIAAELEYLFRRQFAEAQIGR